MSMDDDFDEMIWETEMLRAFGENENEAYKDSFYNPLGDSFSKDMMMSVLRPIEIALLGAVSLAAGLLRVPFNLLPMLMGSSESKMGKALTMAFTGVGLLLLAMVPPFARLFNSATRVYAGLFDAKTEPDPSLNWANERTFSPEKLGKLREDPKAEKLEEILNLLEQEVADPTTAYKAVPEEAKSSGDEDSNDAADEASHRGPR